MAGLYCQNGLLDSIDLVKCLVGPQGKLARPHGGLERAVKYDDKSDGQENDKAETGVEPIDEPRGTALFFGLHTAEYQFPRHIAIRNSLEAAGAFF